MSGNCEDFNPGDVVEADVNGYARTISKRLIRGIGDQWWGPGVGARSVPTSSLTNIRRLTVEGPANPPEPGIGGVVVDTTSTIWVRVTNGVPGFLSTDNWVCGSARCKYEHIEVVEVISKGMPS